MSSFFKEKSNQK